MDPDKKGIIVLLQKLVHVPFPSLEVGFELTHLEQLDTWAGILVESANHLTKSITIFIVIVKP